MKCVEAIGRPEFTLAEVYGFEARLASIYPGDNNVRPKIRQQLQVLRDMGRLEFGGRGDVPADVTPLPVGEGLRFGERSDA